MRAKSELQATVAAAVVRLGAREVAERLGLGIESTLRLASGQTVRRCTEQVARANLSALKKARP